ncbi:cell wall hydrolase [Novosphingobium panipatense]
MLNRVAHPAYPGTVCGVVYQGSERSTGCQFSFTCDGSLARRPQPMFWERARAVARAALAGYVYAPAGLATHYHTVQVRPYWAPSLHPWAPSARTASTPSGAPPENPRRFASPTWAGNLSPRRTAGTTAPPAPLSAPRSILWRCSRRSRPAFPLPGRRCRTWPPKRRPRQHPRLPIQARCASGAARLSTRRATCRARRASALSTQIPGDGLQRQTAHPRVLARPCGQIDSGVKD